MKDINIKAMFTYQGTSMVKAFAIFWAVLFIVTTGIILMVRVFLPEDAITNSQFSIYEMAAFIMALVSGIVALREDLRIAVQHGVGRPTFYLSHLLSALFLVGMLTIGGVILLYLGTWFLTGFDALTIKPLYQSIFYYQGVPKITVGLFLENRLFDFGLYFLGFGLGTFLSLLFYRLNKPWTIVVAIALPLAFIVTLSHTSSGNAGKMPLSPPEMGPVFLWMMLVSLFFLAVSWLLLRRAPVKPL
jgi:hypothetical protein